MKLFLDKIETVLEKFYISEKNYTILKTKVKDLENRINELRKENELLKQNLINMDKVFESMKIKSSHSEDFWSGTADFIIKIIWIIVVSFILYKLGINPPPV